jgi:uracil-DNA glycosylase
MDKDISPSWNKVLEVEFSKEYFSKLTSVVEKSYLDGQVYPPKELIFNAFKLCPYKDVKVVILGQDPYHGAGQAQGLSFSVPDGVKIPPSLRNIYKELESDLGIKSPEAGNLEHWATQGVLLLNATLTVQEGTPGAHQGLGWETFTDTVIRKISEDKEHVVFLLWGKFAESKAVLIDNTKHLILTAPHPSPFSAYRGFLGSKHFSKTNTYLSKHSINSIQW